MNQTAFLEYLNHCFIPGVTKIRDAEKLHGRRAALVMDGFDGHDSPEIQKLLEQFLVKVVWLLPHSSHLTQPLDLVTFSRFKASLHTTRLDWMPEGILGPKDVSPKRLLKDIVALTRVLDPFTSIHAWARAGWTVDWAGKEPTAVFSIEKVLANPRAPESEVKRACLTKKKVSSPKRIKLDYSATNKEKRALLALTTVPSPSQ
jgi:hypothetical protein